MWVIFHEPRTHFTHMDKNVFGVVDDKDILGFQKRLADKLGQIPHLIIEEAKHLQPLVGNHYYAKRYDPMTPDTDIHVPQERKGLGTTKASLFRDVAPLNPYNNEQ